MKKLKPKILESQCIPLDQRLWSVDKTDQFWAARRELLAEAFNDFVRIALTQRRL
ncbi:hypothetical protein [Sorangium cellulosum]|uniref:hypothetical protein n=1 Tax=Sorangium cellulosum TaxID=56 RepID=UPI001331827A|nr:hypothetical protein [Sorangium cellulosum]